MNFINLLEKSSESGRSQLSSGNAVLAPYMIHLYHWDDTNSRILEQHKNQKESYKLRLLGATLWFVLAISFLAAIEINCTHNQFVNTCYHNKSMVPSAEFGSKSYNKLEPTELNYTEFRSTKQQCPEANILSTNLENQICPLIYEINPLEEQSNFHYKNYIDITTYDQGIFAKKLDLEAR